MLKVAICDDQAVILNHYAEFIIKSAQKHHLEVQVFQFLSGEALLFQFDEDPYYADIIYLDIFMNHMSGMETARELRAMNCKAQIIFLTSSADYVYEAFDVNAVQYLLKDKVTEQRFEEIFLRAVAQMKQQEEELFAFEFQGVKKTVPLHQISHLEIWKRVVTVYWNDQKDEFYSSMKELEQKLASYHFVRVHRSFLVHLPFIQELQSSRIMLKNGKEIPVGVTYSHHLKKQFSEFISRPRQYEAE